MKLFILLATPRSGSTVLGNALADHPDIIFYGELFHDNAKRRGDEAGRRTLGMGVLRQSSFGLAPCLNDEPGDVYLRRVFASDLPAAALGFKLFHRQARKGGDARVWTFLEARRDIDIVHLWRQDLLASLVSLERARMTKVWHTRTPGSSQPFSLSKETCQSFFEDYEKGVQAVQPLLNGRRILDVSFEDLDRDYQATLSRVLSFLGVEGLPAPVAPLARLAKMALREEVQNYDELAAHFAASRFARYFP